MSDENSIIELLLENLDNFATDKASDPNQAIKDFFIDYFTIKLDNIELGMEEKSQIGSFFAKSINKIDLYLDDIAMNFMYNKISYLLKIRSSVEFIIDDYNIDIDDDYYNFRDSLADSLEWMDEWFKYWKNNISPSDYEDCVNILRNYCTRPPGVPETHWWWL